MGNVATKPTRLGEVVETSTAQFTAECYSLDAVPEFGAFVRTGGKEDRICGIVASVSTITLDPGRRAVARGWDVDDEDELFHANPEILELLRTQFTCLILGYWRDGVFHHRVPPRPPRIHGFVYECTEDEVESATVMLEYPRTLLSSQTALADDLVAAAIRGAASHRANPREYLVRAGKEVAVLLNKDVTRLNGVLRRLVE